MNRGAGETQRGASEILATFKENPESWTKVDAILEFSTLLETKYFGLQILEQLIQTRWRALPREQCDGIKGYIVSMILDISSDAEKSEQMKLLLQKLNLVLVQVCSIKLPIKFKDSLNLLDCQARMASSLA
jgi:exportin-1